MDILRLASKINQYNILFCGVVGSQVLLSLGTNAVFSSNEHNLTLHNGKVANIPVYFEGNVQDAEDTMVIRGPTVASSV